ncbi:MAG: hypothetical protein A3D92_21010 [Bacteroidetes bacterium RIFCSPHIGHO2_02_FULL_44_7]|nr:MAG: hypothetical protein A3D92_21010 [Bacteroidetes bacterium RIFCSPHIGHO2_02_FULL_44_7]
MEKTTQLVLDFLQRNLGGKDGVQVQSTHRKHLQALFDLGISQEDALGYIFEQRPTAEQYLRWIDGRKRIFPPIEECADVLSKEDLAFWDTNGYIVLRNAVEPDLCAESCEATWTYLGASPNDPESWYRNFEGARGMMLQFSDHPALDAIRNSPKIRKAYEQLYGHSNIYKTIDKTSFNPPEKKGRAFTGSALHWDVSLLQPIAHEFQGLLYLTSTGADDGAFHCVPGFHKRIGAWLKEVPVGELPREYALKHLQAIPVPGNAGDFVIWHQALPHCATPNKGTAPRLVFYMTYLPEGNEEPEVWE